MNENTPQDPSARTESQTFFEPAEGETAAAIEGFHCYFGMPKERRSLKKVAKQLGYNESTVREWSAKFGWKERIQNYQAGLLNTRFQSDAAAAKELALAKVERAAFRREKNTRLGTFLRQIGEKLFERHLWTNLDKMKLPDIIKILELAIKIDALGDEESSTDPNAPEKASLMAQIDASLKRMEMPGLSDLLNPLTQSITGSTPATPEGN